MACAQKRESCTELFKKLHVLLLASKYLLTLITFTTDNLEMFQTQRLTQSTRHKRSSHTSC